MSTFALFDGVSVIAIVFVTLDLDRPQRGLITVPHTALEDVRETMDAP